MAAFVTEQKITFSSEFNRKESVRIFYLRSKHSHQHPLSKGFMFINNTTLYVFVCVHKKKEIKSIN